MIAKAKSIAHGGVSLGYITRQGKAQVVKLNHLPEDASPQAIYGYMKLHQKLREEEFQRRPLKNNMIRMEISPSREESEGWTLEDWKHLMKYSGNDPRRGYIRKKNRELEGMLQCDRDTRKTVRNP